MHPVIFKYGPFTIYSYGLMMAVAVVVCSYFLSREAPRVGIPGEAIFDLVFWTMVAGVVGARIFYVFLNLDYFRGNPQEIWMIQNGGLAFQGGFILGSLAAFLYIKKKRWPFWPTADLAAPYLALGHAIGRIGCFLNGCCYGLPVSWGIYCPVHGERLHPTQLYDTFALSVIFFILKKFQKHSRQPGATFVLYLLLASIERFINEFFRGDHFVTYSGLSVYQWVSLGIFMAGIGLYLTIRRK